MKQSIRTRMVMLLAAVVAGTILICWFANKSFLSDYYEQSKIGDLTDIYNKIDTQYDGSDNDELLLDIEQTGARQNISVYIFNVYSISGGILCEVMYPENLNDFSQMQLRERIREYYLLEPEERTDGAGPAHAAEKLVKAEKYTIYKRFDKRMDTFYLELFGVLSSGNQVFIRCNFNSIQESADVANRFFAYIGLLAIVVGIVVMYFISRTFTKPIQDLSDIAIEVSKLNFEAKYETDREDEIGKLGKSINTMSEKLEKTISELKTANNELQKDIEHKEEIDVMRKEFLSNVSHELKTPIALIQGYAEGLKDNISEDEESRNFYCEVIMDEAGKMNALVQKLMTLNQLEFGNEQTEIERFDLAALIGAVLNTTGIIFKQKDVRLQYNGLNELHAWGDEYGIEEVFTNYISNALNHVDISDDSGIKLISVSLKQENGKVRVSVFNTGERIPDEDIDKIWDKFYKVDKARTREYGGSGVGLSIVKAVMNSMNQQCGVMNHENGVEFWFELDTD